MERFDIGLLMFACTLAIIALRVPVAAAMLLVGGAGYAAINGWNPLFSTLKTMTYSKFANNSMAVLPLFLLMGEFATHGGMNSRLFRAALSWFGHWRGGLAVATIGGCAAFGAICGSSLATAATMSKVALPEMRRAGYSAALATGTLAAGGTLGILIPPSGPMVLFGVVSDTSIGALFMAGVVPGLMLATIFAIYCMTEAKLARHPVKTEPRATAREALAALRRSFWALTLPATVLGGMYFGVFTATEAAAAGALGALAIASLVYRNLPPAEIWRSAIDAARNSAMLFLILAAAALLGNALTKLRIPVQMVELVTHYGLSQTGFLLAVMLVVFVLGMFLETISIILITTPVVLPVLAALHINPIWYGILLTINLELALITPPVGMNLFAIKAITRAPIGEIILGVAPYVALLVVGLGLVLAFPQTALWLPGTMNYK